MYGTFAIVLGLLFWIYLLAQVVVYSVEIATVRSFGLWPRSMNGDELTDSDKKAYALQASTERQIPAEHIKTQYNDRT